MAKLSIGSGEWAEEAANFMVARGLIHSKIDVKAGGEVYIRSLGSAWGPEWAFIKNIIRLRDPNQQR